MGRGLADRQIERLVAEGTNAYVTKPIDVAEFLLVVAEHLPAPTPATSGHTPE